jgi:hypothetical protein
LVATFATRAYSKRSTGRGEDPYRKNKLCPLLHFDLSFCL